MQAGASLQTSDLEKNGAATTDAIYKLIYNGKGKMPGYGKECTPRVNLPNKYHITLVWSTEHHEVQADLCAQAMLIPAKQSTARLITVASNLAGTCFCLLYVFLPQLHLSEAGLLQGNLVSFC